MKRLRALFLAPSAITLWVLFFCPLLIVVAYSFESRGPYGGVELPWTAESYQRIIDSLYIHILLRTVWIAAVATSLCLVIAFPLAIFIARAPRHRALLLNLVMLPFWTSFLIRTYAWMFLLRDTGPINHALLVIHAIAQPLPLLFNTGAVLLGLVYGYLPYMVLPLYAAIEKLDPALLDAAADLGARPWTATLRITLPLAIPGITAGCLLVFIPCLGAYLTPDLMGGGKTVLLGNLIQNQFTTARDWPFGAAISLVLMIVVLTVARLIRHRGEQLL